MVPDHFIICADSLLLRVLMASASRFLRSPIPLHLSLPWTIFILYRGNKMSGQHPQWQCWCALVSLLCISQAPCCPEEGILPSVYHSWCHACHFPWTSCHLFCLPVFLNVTDSLTSSLVRLMEIHYRILMLNGPRHGTLYHGAMSLGDIPSQSHTTATSGFLFPHILANICCCLCSWK
jgi:hypothetical protein